MEQKFPKLSAPHNIPSGIWDIHIPDPFKNCQKIHPLAQSKAAAAVKIMSLDPDVEKIIIFGSSVSERCHEGSDLDIYVQLKKEKKLPVLSLDFVYDRWTNYTVSPEMMNEINKKGVVVYG